MNLSQVCAAIALAATVVLTVLLVNRPPGPFVDINVFVYAAIAFGVSWVFTLGALRVVQGVPYSAVLFLHLIGGTVGFLGIFFVLSHDSEWWILPCAAFATVLPLLVNAAAFAASWRPVLVVVVGLQAACVVLVPAGYFLRVVMKERANVAYNANWNEELHQRSNAIPANATIDQYFPFVVEPRHQGIAEHAARLLARRADHEAMLIAALQGPKRFEALCLLAVDGIPPTAALATAVKRAIESLPAEKRKSEIVREVAKRFSLVQA